MKSVVIWMHAVRICPGGDSVAAPLRAGVLGTAQVVALFARFCTSAADVKWISNEVLNLLHNALVCVEVSHFLDTLLQCLVVPLLLERLELLH